MNEHEGQIVPYRRWLSQSGETLGDCPIFFHYVNVGRDVRDGERITDVHLPLKDKKVGLKESPKRSNRP